MPTSSNENEDRLKSDNREESGNIDEDRADRGSHDPHYGQVKNPWERIGEIDETALKKLTDYGKNRGQGWDAYTNTLV